MGFLSEFLWPFTKGYAKLATKTAFNWGGVPWAGKVWWLVGAGLGWHFLFDRDTQYLNVVQAPFYLVDGVTEVVKVSLVQGNVFTLLEVLMHSPLLLALLLSVFYFGISREAKQ